MSKSFFDRRGFSTKYMAALRIAIPYNLFRLFTTSFAIKMETAFNLNELELHYFACKDA